MAEFFVKTKNQADVGKKPRVYFTCHPADFEACFDKICEDLFSTHDCAVYYIADMTAPIAEEEREVDLGRNNLFVVPVTLKLLTTPNRAMDEDVPYAVREHIPVLPIMMEPGLDAIYSRPDKFGELQYLNPNSSDITEVSYAEKLRKYLDAVLISGEMAERIRAAFDAYIFLSYRKKDRKYANQLMRIIHANPECRSIAVWFDEFLTPGESFRDTIAAVLEDSKLFTLLVTPQLLEKTVDENGEERDNFVVAEELPLARKKGTEIFAVEMEETDRDGLAALDIADPFRTDDGAFRARLLDTVSKIGISTNDTPEHNFLIGLAYLDGIDVEVDRARGIDLITRAAEAGLPEAMFKCHAIYENGIGTTVDYQRAVYWAQQLAMHYTDELGADHPSTLSLYNLVVTGYARLGEYRKALELGKTVHAARSIALGETHPDTLVSLINLVSVHNRLGEYQTAAEMGKIAFTLTCKTRGAEHPDTLTALNNLAAAYTALGDDQNALELNEMAYGISCRVQGEAHPKTLGYLNNLAVSYRKLGNLQKALELHETAYRTACKGFGEDHPDTLVFLGNLAISYEQAGNRQKALELMETVCALRVRVLGEDHPDTKNSLRSLDNLRNRAAKANPFGGLAKTLGRIFGKR